MPQTKYTYKLTTECSSNTFHFLITTRALLPSQSVSMTSSSWQPHIKSSTADGDSILSCEKLIFTIFTVTDIYWLIASTATPLNGRSHHQVHQPRGTGGQPTVHSSIEYTPAIRMTCPPPATVTIVNNIIILSVSH